MLWVNLLSSLSSLAGISSATLHTQTSKHLLEDSLLLNKMCVHFLKILWRVWAQSLEGQLSLKVNSSKGLMIFLVLLPIIRSWAWTTSVLRDRATTRSKVACNNSPLSLPIRCPYLDRESLVGITQVQPQDSPQSSCMLLQVAKLQFSFSEDKHWQEICAEYLYN